MNPWSLTQLAVTGTQWTEIDIFESTGSMASGTFPQQLNTHTHIFYIDGVAPATIEKDCGCKIGPQGLPWTQPSLGVQYPVRASNLCPSRLADNQSVCTYGKSQLLPFNMSDDFHIFGLEWDPVTLRVYVDTQLWFVS